MADKTPAPVVVPAAPFKFDAERCKAHLTAVRVQLETFAGKRNCNPYLVIGRLVDPLLFDLNKGTATKELQDAILALDKNMIPWMPGFKPTDEDKAAVLKK